MKIEIGTFAGCIAGIITTAFGGWDSSIIALLICMIVDYILGIICAAYGVSKKTESGNLSSAAGFKGLVKKGIIMLVVLVAVQLDTVLKTSFIRDAVCIGFILNEVLSIIENAGLMGVKIPAVISKAIDLLKEQSEAGNTTDTTNSTKGDIN